MQQSDRNLATRKLVTYMLAFTLAMSNMMFSSGAMARSYMASNYNVDPDPSGGTMLLDTVLVRPAMLVATVGGLVAFIVTSPFSLIGGNLGEAGSKLVVEPAAYTFVRPLGKF